MQEANRCKNQRNTGDKIMVVFHRGCNGEVKSNPDRAIKEGQAPGD
jgi:hypothetical protein